MKQRISVEQLNDLTDEQKERLREWWNPQYGDFTATSHLSLNDEPQLHETIIGLKIERKDYKGDTYIVYEDLGAGCDSEGGTYDIGKEELLPLLSIGQMIELLQSTKTDWTPVPNESWNETDICDQLWTIVKHRFFGILEY